MSRVTILSTSPREMSKEANFKALAKSGLRVHFGDFLSLLLDLSHHPISGDGFCSDQHVWDAQCLDHRFDLNPISLLPFVVDVLNSGPTRHFANHCVICWRVQVRVEPDVGENCHLIQGTYRFCR